MLSRAVLYCPGTSPISEPGHTYLCLRTIYLYRYSWYLSPNIVALCHTWSLPTALSPTKSQHHPLPKMLWQGEDYAKGDGKHGDKTWTLRIRLNTAGHTQAIPPNLYCLPGAPLIFCEVSPTSINLTH